MKTHPKRSFIAVLSLEFAVSSQAHSLSGPRLLYPLPAIEAKAHAMIAKLTLEEIELLGGVDKMFTVPMPAIDLPRFKMSDASLGVRTWGPTTAYAGGVALAATWDTDFARQLGEGRDATLAHGASTSCLAPA